MLLGLLMALVAPNAVATAAVGPEGSISGLVTDADGAPITTQDICVEANGKPFTDTDDRGFTRTDAAGRFTIAGLDAGTYVVQARNCSDSLRNDVAEFHEDGENQSEARGVDVRAGEDTPLDFSLARGTTISGTIYGGPGTDRPLGRACVDVYHANASTVEGRWVRTVGAAADGTYRVTRLAPGGYRLKFSTCFGVVSDWSPTFYDGTSRPSGASVVTATLDAPATGIDGHLLPAASIGGTVTDRAGAPIPGICVEASDAGGDTAVQSARAATDAAGRYRLRGLSGGRFHLDFSECENPGSRYATVRLSGAPWWESTIGPTVAVDDSTERTGVDMVMGPATTITGRVSSDPAGLVPVKGACAEVRRVADDAVGSISARTGADGTYTVRGLPEGAYTVRFSGCEAAGDFTPVWYENGETERDAKVVRTSGEGPVTGIDGHLVPALTATIAGRVTGAGGAPLEGVCVDAYSETQGGAWGSATTGADGRYTMTRLAGGTYRVRFHPCRTPDYVGEYWDDELGYYGATLVKLPAGGARLGIDAELERAVKISGTVRGQDGAPLRDICVSATPVSGESIGTKTLLDQTAKDGTYTIGGIPQIAGGYRVSFRDCGTRELMTVFYGGDDRRESATPVIPTLAQPATGIDMTMSTGGVIAGQATEADGRPVDGGVCVSARRTSATGAEYTLEQGVEADGRYRISRLPSGTYEVRFRTCWNSERNDLDQLRQGVAVTVGQTTAGIDATMRPAPSISGHVYAGAGTAKPLARVCVTGWVEVPGGMAGTYTARTDATGAYTLRRIAPGSAVRVSFADCDANEHRSAIYGGATDLRDPNAVVLRPTSEAPSTGIDAHLERVAVEEPGEPTVPTEPTVPQEPSLPETPAQPATPETPARPETPAVQPPAPEAADAGDRPVIAAPAEQQPVGQAEPQQPAAPAPAAAAGPAPAATTQRADSAATPAPRPQLRLTLPRRPATAAGLRVTAAGTPGTTVTARATLDRRTARRLGLPTTIGTARTTLAAGRATLTVKLSARVKRALRRAGATSVTVTLVGDGARVTRKLVLSVPAS